MNESYAAGLISKIENMEFKYVVGNVAIICTVLSMFAGVEICVRIKKRGSTNDITGFPFVAGFLCSVLWLTYGLLVRDPMIISVNLFGLVMQSLYTSWYIYYTIDKRTISRQLFSVCLFLLSVLFYHHYIAMDDAQSTAIAGWLGASASVLVTAAPMAALADVIRTKSVRNLPFPLILTMFFMASLWAYYGHLINDRFVQIPNLLGALLASFQLSLFLIYPSKPSADSIGPDYKKLSKWVLRN